jgi:hypothetical protein
MNTITELMNKKTAGKAKNVMLSEELIDKVIPLMIR